MIISSGGIGCIKIQHGDLTVALSPVSKKSKHQSASFGADVAFVSINHPDANGVETVARGDKNPFIVNGPGEYEINGMFIKGYLSKSNYGKTERYNTIYTFEIDNIKVAYFGALGETDIDPKVKEALGDVDIVFVPIGGDGVLEPDDAYSFAIKREPKIIIPIFYGETGNKDALKTFLKEGSAEGTKAQEKVTLKRRDVDTMNGEIIVLQ